MSTALTSDAATPASRPGGDIRDTLSLPAIIAARARAHPERPFLTEVNGHALTYGEFQAAALRWCAGFAALDVGAGENVAVLTGPSADAYAVWIGLAWSGGRSTGVNPALRGSSLHYVIDNCQARVIVTESEHLPALEEIADTLSSITAVVVLDHSEVAATSRLPLVAARELLDRVSDKPQPLSPPGLHDIAVIVYTSGTTGPSKGVLVPWGQVLAANRLWDDLSEHDIYYASFPMYHMAGRSPLGYAAYPGGQLVVRRRFKTEHFWDDMTAHRCTAASMVPVMIEWLLGQPPSASDHDTPLAKISVAPVPPRIEEFQTRFGVRARTVFGMTETNPILTTGAELVADHRSCGRPRPDIEARIVDDLDYEVPRGSVGELIVRSNEPWTLNAGYFNMPDKTAEAWRNGWFHTGDNFRQDGLGEFYFVDRKRDTLRRRGENISSWELERAVVAHPAVAEVAAIGVPEPSGEEEIKVVIVLAPDATLLPAALEEQIGRDLPAYMVPRYVEFVSELPRTAATQKVRKAELRERGHGAATWERHGAMDWRKYVRPGD